MRGVSRAINGPLVIQFGVGALYTATVSRLAAALVGGAVGVANMYDRWRKVNIFDV